MTTTINYRTLTLARESRGVTQSKLANSIKGLTQGNLSRMEKGLLSVSNDLLDEIAKFLNYPKIFFYKDYQTSTSSSLFYRKRISMSQKQLSILEAKIDIINSVIDILLESIDVPEMTIPHVDIWGEQTPSKVAFKMREYLNVPKGPINNPVSILEKRGVIVIFLDTDNDKFDGVTKFTQKSQPVIYINNRIPNDRKRFTLYHELGHLVMHLRQNISEDVDDNEKEKQANEFSAEFNLPYVECKRSFLNLRFNELNNLKQYWRMSKAAILHRAKEIGCINEHSYRYYMVVLSKKGERKNEVGRVDIDTPLLLKKIIEAHLSVLGYDKEELAELVGLSNEDFSTLYENGNFLNPKFRIVI